MNLLKIFFYLFILYFVNCEDDIINDEDNKIKEGIMFIQQLEKIINEVEIEYKFKANLTDEEKNKLENLTEEFKNNSVEFRKIIKDLIDKYEKIKEEDKLEKITCEEYLEKKKKYEEKCNVNSNKCNLEEDICNDFCK